MSEKREVVIIGGGGYSLRLSSLIANAIINSSINVMVLGEDVVGLKFDRVIVGESYPFNELYGLKNMPVPTAYIDYDQPKSQKPWKTGYIPQHRAGPSYYPSDLLLNLVERVK